MSRLNPEDSHKGLSHPALLEILKTAAKRAQDTYSSVSVLMTEMSRQRFREEGGVSLTVQFSQARCSSG